MRKFIICFTNAKVLEFEGREVSSDSECTLYKKEDNSLGVPLGRECYITVIKSNVLYVEETIL